MIKKRIEMLRVAMKAQQLDYYLIPTNDYHLSEYTGEFFQARKFFSGFTGSAGVLLVGLKEAILWTDGRYYIQAEKELENTTIQLYKQGLVGVDTVGQYLMKHLKKEMILGFDGRVVDTLWGQELAMVALKSQAKVNGDIDLIEQIWTERPSLSEHPLFLLGDQYAGESRVDKLKRLRTVMMDKACDTHVLATLDDIAWLLNIRGRDVKHFPVVLSYCIVTLDECYLYIDQQKVSKENRVELEKDQITIKSYEDFYQDLKVLKAQQILIDQQRTNYKINLLIKNHQCVYEKSPIVVFKAVKNQIEIENIKNIHIKDGVAFTKWMYWIKTSINQQKLTEKEVADYIDCCRAAIDGYVEPSFQTICGYREHAAMMHYAITEESNAQLEARDSLLLDSGGHYLEGSTDITRTIALGEVKDEVKTHFTAVLKGMLNLSEAKFLYGCSGLNLDILARGPLWDLEIDYKCGTGHGIGYLLNVHEPPNGFRWRVVPERDDSYCLEAGMVTTNEPGVYIEGSHGIRIENELLCVKGNQDQADQWMHFETITYAPIDLDMVKISELSEIDKKRLNNYHQMVYEKLSPYLDQEIREWLKQYTRAV